MLFRYLHLNIRCKFQVDVDYWRGGRVYLDCWSSLYIVCKTRPYKISVNVGAGFTNNNCLKQTILKTSPHPRKNHHLHLNIRCKFQVDVDYWRGGRVYLDWWSSLYIVCKTRPYKISVNVGAGFTNNNCLKQTILKTRPHPRKNHHLHLNIRCKFQVDVDYWRGGRVYLDWWSSLYIVCKTRPYKISVNVGAGFTNNNCLKQTILKTRPHPRKNHHLHINIRCKFQVDMDYWRGGRVYLDCCSSLYIVCKTRPYKISVNVGAGFTNNNCLKQTILKTSPHPRKNHHLHLNIRCKFQVDVDYWRGGRVYLDCWSSLYIVCKTRPYKISVNVGAGFTNNNC